MNAGIDKYAGLDSPFHRWDARYKLVALLVLVFAFSFIKAPYMLMVMVLVTVAMYIVSRLPVRFILSWLRIPSFIILMIVLTLPFLSGESVLLQLGPLAVYREGLMAALLIVVRFICIVTVGVTMLGTTPVLHSIQAMRALGLPFIMADMAFLTLRYLHELRHDLGQMLTSMKLRGFRRHTFSPGGLKMFAWLSGSLLVRSYERSELVYHAMIVRGYGNSSSPQEEFQSKPADMLIFGVIILVAAMLVTGDILFRHMIEAIL